MFTLLTFTCSTIQADQMFSSTPWEYVKLDPSGNNLESDLDSLRLIMRTIRLFEPAARFVVMIGNTDPYYIYLQQFKNIPASQRSFVLEQFAKRWEIYRDRLQSWIDEKAPDLNAEVASWFSFEREIEASTGRSFEKEFDEVLIRIDDLAQKKDMDQEFEALEQQFGLGKYFEGLERPDQSLLKDWIRRKFAEYTLQALWIKELMPEVKFLQNEKPRQLRTQMYQPLVQEKYSEPFEVLQLFSDDKGYS